MEGGEGSGQRGELTERRSAGLVSGGADSPLRESSVLLRH